MSKELISNAAARRFREVRERVNDFDPQRFGEGGLFVTSVKELLRQPPESGVTNLLPFSEISHWSAPDTDCLTALRVLSLHGSKTMPRAPHPTAQDFLSLLKTKGAARARMFDLLADRYAWPPNFSFAAEDAIREFLLMRLMTSDRARLESASPAALEADDLLLKLNLIGVHACATKDLRFLDALNYYYELLPTTLFPESRHAWLLVSFFALYARALHSWL